HISPFFFLMTRPHPSSTLFPYTTLFRSLHQPRSPSGDGLVLTHGAGGNARGPLLMALGEAFAARGLTVLRYDLPFRQARRTGPPDRKSTRLNSSHVAISYAVFCLKKKKT